MLDFFVCLISLLTSFTHDKKCETRLVLKSNISIDYPEKIYYNYHILDANNAINNQMASIDILRFLFILRNYFFCRNNAIINQMKLEHFPVICDIVNKYTSKWFDEALIIINCCTVKLNKKVSKKDKKTEVISYIISICLYLGVGVVLLL